MPRGEGGRRRVKKWGHGKKGRGSKNGGNE